MHINWLFLASSPSSSRPSFLIEPGLTGIVGPNGCGKSNLVEALRWVMGETSDKAHARRRHGRRHLLRHRDAAAAQHRRGHAVHRQCRPPAPAEFNEPTTLEVTRRIEREAGSVYRVNGREVRARDVQLLFADASTGARSPALVRQGRSASYRRQAQHRRALLEDAAGIAGLHSRRHEAELRLRRRDNLARLDDVLGELDCRSRG